MRDFHNKWHNGASVTILQVLDDCMMYDSNWRAHADSINLTSRSCGKQDMSWTSQAWSWIADKYKKELKVSGKDEWLCAKAFVNLISKIGWYKEWRTWMSANVDFRDRNMCTPVAIYNIHTLLVTLNETFSGTMSKDSSIITAIQTDIQTDRHTDIQPYIQ